MLFLSDLTDLSDLLLVKISIVSSHVAVLAPIRCLVQCERAISSVYYPHPFSLRTYYVHFGNKIIIY